MKALPAIIFALGMTAVVAVAMFLIGANALVNQNSVPVLNAPSTGAGAVQNASFSADQQQAAQLEQLVAQYQAREKQYQAELNDAAQHLTQANQQLDQANQQLDQASQQVQAYQQTLERLQEIGLIRIDQNGRIFLGRQGGDGD
ncbi:MAG TPA: hypothetical protein VMT46_12765 [Anaerolineaceae bacterium]|nr:hypothetical protein [Anaerolineaceae bacterium]